jgi:cyclohexanecarboxylate-CoA ligase
MSIANPTTEIDHYYRAGLWRTDATLLDDLYSAVSRYPGRRAVVCWHTDGRPPDTLTYAELAREVDRFAAGLVRLGVRRGDVVTLQLPNSVWFVALCLACARAGAVACPVLPVMRAREVGFALRLTESPVYIGPAVHRGYSLGDMSRQLHGSLDTLRHRVLLDPGPDDLAGGAVDFAEALLGIEPTPGELAELDRRAPEPDDLAQLIFTSGTTGEPKGVLHSYNTLHAINRVQADALDLTDDIVTAMGSPTTHQAGYTWNMIMPLMLGGTAIQIDAWDPDLMLRILEAERVSFFMGAPPFLVDLIAAQRRTPRDLSTLRSFVTGSAPIPPVLVEQATEVLGCHLHAIWGMTENGCVTITRRSDGPMRAAASDGSPVFGMRVRIVRDDQGRPVEPGGIGRLQVRGANQCLGYFRRPEVYEASLYDGWFDTGDLAREDGYGGIRLAGRAKDIVCRGGENIPVVEVEAVLLRHEHVRAVAVVGYPDPRLGERACAFVVPDGTPPTLPELQRHLVTAGMAKQYWPERLELVPALPTTQSGKVQKFRLREQLAAG